MITNLEERSSYDTSNFLADMGGSLGFLLGLSVIGIIIVLEKILGYLFLDKLVNDYKQKTEKKASPKESKVMETN
jgi:Amiloride-sensitive sodium channel